MGRPAPEYVAERFALPAAPLRVDEEKCVISGVRVLGPRSRNGHKYTAEYRRSLMALFESMGGAADCYWGHHFDPATRLPFEPPPDKKVGRHVNLREEGDALHTDLRYNPECPHARQLVWAAKNDPAQLSISQLARVGWRPGRDADGDRVAEACLALNSFDVVCQGGATSTVFESFTREAADMANGDEGGSVATTTVELPDADAIAKMLKDDPALAIAFLAKLIPALGLDQAAKDQVVGLLSATAPEPPAGDTADAAVAPAMESLRRMGKVGRWAAGVIDSHRRKAWAAKLVDAEALPAHLRTDLFVETVAESFGNPDRAKALIAERKQLGGTPAAGGKRDPVTSTPGGGGGKTVEQIVAEYAAG